MGQCQVQGMEQMEQDFTQIQIHVKTLKAVPEKMNELEAKINQVKKTAEDLTHSVSNITKTIESLKESIKI